LVAFVIFSDLQTNLQTIDSFPGPALTNFIDCKDKNAEMLKSCLL
jgi:hypothetical protein